MLADGSTPRALGQLSAGVLQEGHSRSAILDFILDQLPRWRDRADRPQGTSETVLTSQLCAHLNSVTRRAPGFDCLQFRTEEADEVEPSRKIDLVAAPATDVLIVQGRSYSDFQTILPIECKRLPIPPDKSRDEREYVTSKVGVGGGIQRFKEGKHGAAHERAALIAYVQAHTFDHWFVAISGWIRDLHQSGNPGWSPAEGLVSQLQDSVAGIAVYESVHRRVNLPAIRLRHLWVKMTA